MASSYNISFTIAAVIIAVVLLIIMSLYYSSSNLVNKRYKYFLISSIVMFSMNILTVYTNDYCNVVPKWLNYLLNSIYFFSGAVVAVLFLYYCVSVALVDTKKQTKRILYIINISGIAIFLISLIVNCFTGMFFSFENGPYEKGPAYLLVNAVSLLFVIESIVILFIKSAKFNKRQIICNALFYAVFFGSYVLQILVFPKTLLSDFATALGGLIIFFSIETPDYAKLMKTLEELDYLKSSLEIQVEERTKELDAKKESYEQLSLETLSALALLVDAKDHYTNGHSFRVAAYAKGIAKILDKPANYIEQLYFAGLIHDVGKIGIKESILSKPGSLTDEEFKSIKSHAAIGGDILKGIKEFKIFEDVARHHHERYDGSGYPDGLHGEDIPYSARIVAICDAFDAMTSDRSYRKALKDDVAINELIKGKGTQFDPKLVDVFLFLYKEYPDSIRNHIDELKK